MAESEEQGKPRQRRSYFSRTAVKPSSSPRRSPDAMRAHAEAQDAARIAFDKETIAAKALAAIQAEALNPEGGWWRPKHYRAGGRAGSRAGLTLREDAVANAYSVGCTRAQIISASGCTLPQADSVKIRIRSNPPTWPVTSEGQE